MSLVRPFTDPRAGPGRRIVSGTGAHVTDSEGNVFLDAVAGLWCASLGFSNERLIRAAEAQMRRLPYYHSFMGREADGVAALADDLAALAPAPIAHFAFACSGSEAVETAVKLAWYAWNARGGGHRKNGSSRARAPITARACSAPG